MKDKILLLGMISVLLGITSCSDKEPDITPVEPGTEINFGSTLQPTSDIHSRTYYGDPITEGNKTVWPIYWNPSTNADHIFIYSPEAVAGRNQAKYTVVRNEQHPEQAANISKDGAFGVQAGTASTYNFYGLYPASAVTSPATGTTINGTLSGSQAAVFTGTEPSKNAPEITTAPTPQGGNIDYYMKPDMSACLMTAEEKDITLSADNPVNMIFKPFATCIDITVNGPETNTTTAATTVHVTEVRVVSKSGNLSGDFSYDFATGEVTIVKGTNNISIDTKIEDSEGDMIGIPLMSGNKLHLQAFILPSADINDLTVQVVTTEEFKTYSKNLVVTNLGKGQINPVTLPVINLEEGEVDYSIWLSQLDPRIYVSEVSLPGASAAFSSVLSDGDLNKMQTKSLADLFKSGIRVFQSHVWIDNQMSSIDGGSTSILVSVNGSPVSYQSRYLALGDVITSLTNQMANDHSEEFCVLLLSEYTFGNGFTRTEFYNRLKTALESEQMKKYIVTDFGPGTTIGDIKGKVLVKYAVNDNSGDATSLLNGTNALFNLWESSESTGSTTKVNYSSLQWQTATGLTNSSSFTTPSTDNMLYIHAEQTNPISWSSALSNNYSWNSYVSNQISAYNRQYDSFAHNIFGMSYLGGAGSSHTAFWSTVTVTPTDVADHFNNIWTSATNNNTTKPFGWVVVNMVGTTSTDAVIKKVIDQNVAGFKLNRDRKNVVVPPDNSPQGDAEAPVAGPSVF